MVSTPQAIEIPYQPDSSRLFEPLAAEPWSVFLDSNHPHYGTARYDILTALPRATLVTWGPLTSITSTGGTHWSSEDPFSLVKRELLQRSAKCGPLPFRGGAVGYFAYDLGRRLERLPERAIADIELPDLAVGVYDWAVVVDHQEGRSWVTDNCPLPLRRKLRAPQPNAWSDFRLKSPIIADMDASAYARAFERVQYYIREGDCYQVNLARRFSAGVDGHPWALFRRLREVSPAPFAAYLHTPYGALLSSSPERFIQVQGGQVRTCPIKGTRARADCPEEDRRMAEQLRRSVKDQAENIMIVDLLRNDLGRTCATGSIDVPRLLELETFPNVHHLVSTVTGRLEKPAHALDALRACFPGGSVTGAPKIRAMEIIEELEPHRRTAYCGAIGYVGYDGNMDTSIAIRTLVHQNETIHFWAGGGIVADSKLELEQQEILEKARGMLLALGSDIARDRPAK